MNISSILQTAYASSLTGKADSTSGGEGFAAFLEAGKPSEATAPAGTAFDGAPSFAQEWALKYGVDIYKQTLSKYAQKGTPDAESGKLSVHIHPTALARMENDLEFRAEMEQKIADAAALFASDEYKENGVKGMSLTINADGSTEITLAYAEAIEVEDDELLKKLMKKVDEICESVHLMIMEKVAQQEANEVYVKAAAEGQRLKMVFEMNNEAVPEQAVV